MDDRTICLLSKKKVWLDTPRTDSSSWKITENLLNFTEEHGDILVCQYQTLKNHP